MQFYCDEQYPSLSASYRLDLSEPFTIVPESFDESINKKRALLIGVNYNKHTDAKLTTSHDDVKSIKVRITYVGFFDNIGTYPIIYAGVFMQLLQFLQ